MMSGRRAVWGLWALGIALLVGVGAAFIWLRPAAKPAPATPPGGSSSPAAEALGFIRLVGHEAPDFSLLDQFGRVHRMSSFRGEGVLLTFISSRCTNVCPLTALLLRRAGSLLGPRAADTAVVAVNTNAAHASVRDVLRWSRRHDMTHRWLFLTGAPLGPVSGALSGLPAVWREYGVTGGGAHTTVVFVIDPDGRIRSAVPIARRASIDAEAQAMAKYLTAMEPRDTGGS
jgi:cytochrome oxidase Cu insertion factor (SCO1/SenC/PrrC family)